MTYGATAFINLIEEWMRDAKFHQILRYGEERHWLSVTGLRETNHSDILAWLLNAEEGHGLGDFFLRRLLVDAMTADRNAEEVARLVEKGKWPRLAELLGDGLSGFQVAREVACGDIQIGKRTEKGFVDILLLNRQRRLAILIERKASRIAGAKQLEKYESWLDDHYKQYDVLKVVSDTGLIDQDIALERRWLVIDDDWLLAGLTDVFAQKRTSDRVCQRLADYLATLQWDEDADPYYAGISADLDTFAATHSKGIKALREMRLLDVPVRRISSRVLMGDVLPALAHRKIQGQNKADIEKAGELAARYWKVIDAILDRSSFNVLEEEIRKAAPEEFAYRHFRHRSGQQEMRITPVEYEDRHPLPLVLEVCQIESQLEDEGQPSQRARVRLRMQSGGFDEAERNAGAVQSVLALFGRKQTTQENVTLQVHNHDKYDVTLKDLKDSLKRLRQMADSIKSGASLT